MADYGWAALAAGTVAAAVLLFISIVLTITSRRPSTRRRLGLVDGAAGLLGMIYVFIAASGGGMVWVIGALSCAGLLVLAAFNLQRIANASPPLR